MNKPAKYKTATAFRRALEDRLKKISDVEGIDLQRLRRQVSFDRLLARLFHDTVAPWVLKGGYAMELRTTHARATRDVDLALRQKLAARQGSPNEQMLDALRDAVARDLSDFFSFRIEAPVMDLDGAPYGGARFPVVCDMDGRTFSKFHLDVGVGDVIIEPLEKLRGRDWLGFAGIVPGEFPALSKEQQFAEKLHAYSLPRTVPNSRVRDLVDMVLLVESGELDRQRVSNALAETFKRRGTHDIPEVLTAPPESWRVPFVAMARECQINFDVNEAFQRVAAFFDKTS